MTFFRPFICFLSAILLVMTAGCSEKSPEAEREISLGRLKLKSFGLQGDFEREYAALLQERCKVDVEYVPGKVGSQEEQAIDRYNRRMSREIEKRFGAGILDQIRDEAMVKVAARHLPKKS
ncbi:MAG: hypothetical protein ABSG86_16650 [Thermoguttaceae bacterium]|jgi:hypothetical protein